MANSLCEGSDRLFLVSFCINFVPNKDFILKDESPKTMYFESNINEENFKQNDFS